MTASNCSSDSIVGGGLGALGVFRELLETSDLFEVGMEGVVTDGVTTDETTALAL